MSIGTVVSGVLGWLRGGRWKKLLRILGLGALGLALPAFGIQQFRLGLLQAENKAQARSIGELTAANSGLALTIDSIKADLARSRAALIQREEANHAAEREISNLRKRLEKAERTDKDYRDWADAPLPDVVRGMLPGAAD